MLADSTPMRQSKSEAELSPRTYKPPGSKNSQFPLSASQTLRGGSRGQVVVTIHKESADDKVGLQLVGMVGSLVRIVAVSPTSPLCGVIEKGDVVLSIDKVRCEHGHRHAVDMLKAAHGPVNLIVRLHPVGIFSRSSNSRRLLRKQGSVTINIASLACAPRVLLGQLGDSRLAEVNVKLPVETHAESLPPMAGKPLELVGHGEGQVTANIDDARGALPHGRETMNVPADERVGTMQKTTSYVDALPGLQPSTSTALCSGSLPSQQPSASTTLCTNPINAHLSVNAESAQHTSIQPAALPDEKKEECAGSWVHGASPSTAEILCAASCFGGAHVELCGPSSSDACTLDTVHLSQSPTLSADVISGFVGAANGNRVAPAGPVVTSDATSAVPLSQSQESAAVISPPERLTDTIDSQKRWLQVQEHASLPMRCALRRWHALLIQAEVTRRLKTRAARWHAVTLKMSQLQSLRKWRQSSQSQVVNDWYASQKKQSPTCAPSESLDGSASLLGTSKAMQPVAEEPDGVAKAGRHEGPLAPLTPGVLQAGWQELQDSPDRAATRGEPKGKMQSLQVSKHRINVQRVETAVAAAVAVAGKVSHAVYMKKTERSRSAASSSAGGSEHSYDGSESSNLSEASIPSEAALRMVQNANLSVAKAEKAAAVARAVREAAVARRETRRISSPVSPLSSFTSSPKFVTIAESANESWSQPLSP